MFGSIGEIYRQNGILGFFSGLIPRLLGDILTVLIANTLTFVINTYIVEEKDLQVYTSATMMVTFSQYIDHAECENKLIIAFIVWYISLPCAFGSLLSC